jgi:type II secretory pathway pseudopilin PulG
MLNNTRNTREFSPMRICSSKGFAIREFLIVLLVMGLFATIGVMALMEFKKKACLTLVRYDLKNFFVAEQMFYGFHDTYKGGIGDIISNDPDISSTLSLDDYSPSINTSITITDDVPLVAVGRNEGFTLTFVYNTTTHYITERQ